MSASCKTRIIRRQAPRRTPRRELEAARTRKLAAEARLAELELTRQEGELVTVEDAERELGLILDRLRARLLAAPGKYAPALVGCSTIAEAMVRFDAAIREIMADLVRVADELEGPDESGGEIGARA